MTIVKSGLDGMAIKSGSTWLSCKIGTGTATAAIGDTDLTASVAAKGVDVFTAINNVVTFDALFSPSQGNPATASNISEIGLFDTSTGGNMLNHSVASTNTWTAFTKDTSRYVLVSIQLVFSA